MIEHVFVCQTCGKEAGRVSCMRQARPFLRTRATQYRKSPFSRGTEDAGSSRLIMRCWFVELAFDKFNVATVMTAIGKGDAGELHRIDDEMVPFWCPKCPATYCRDHWENWPVFDESFFDEMRGRCPKGHERRMTD